VSNGDVPLAFNSASFFVRPDFRVFQHNRASWVTAVERGERPLWVECGSLSAVAQRSAVGAERKHVTLPTGFRSPLENPSGPSSLTSGMVGSVGKRHSRLLHTESPPHARLRDDTRPRIFREIDRRAGDH